MTITYFKNLDRIIGWDDARQSQCYLKGSDLAFKDREITYVCQTYQGASDRTIDGAGLCLIPRFRQCPFSSLYGGALPGRSRESFGPRERDMTGLYERSYAFGAHDDDKK